MARLSADPDAYIRPSPAAGTLGGVARATTQAMTVLEAAGYDVVLVETVGVGQSEITVAGMVDTFLFLTLARTGDQLQGIKKGILEIADVIAVNKADGDREAGGPGGRPRAGRRAAPGARGHDEWAPPVVTCSALEDTGVDDLWERVLAHREHLGDDGLAAQARRPAARLHLGAGPRRARAAAAALARVAAVREEVRAAVLAGELTATVAADRILAAYDGTGEVSSRAIAARVTRPRNGSNGRNRGDLTRRRVRDGRPVRRRGRPPVSLTRHVFPQHPDRRDDREARRRADRAPPRPARPPRAVVGARSARPSVVAKRLDEAGLRVRRAAAQRADRRHRAESGPAGRAPRRPRRAAGRGPHRRPVGQHRRRASPTPAATTCTPPRCSAPGSRWPRPTPPASCPAGCGCSSSPPRRSCPAARSS